MRQRLKNIIQQILHKYGYSLIRHSKYRDSDFPHEESFWNDFFKNDPDKLTQIYKKNRDLLGKIDDWMPHSVHKNSIFRYGIPESHLGNNNISSINTLAPGFTYSDLLIYLCTTIDTPHYLEIGVSSGKNFYQILNALTNAKLYGIDIEVINPVLEKILSDKKEIWQSENKYEFQKYGGKLEHIYYSLAHYKFNSSNNEVYYMRGDKFSRDLWKSLAGNKFNIIFSDAFHHPESIRSEYNYMVEFDLFDNDRCTMIWDDLDKPEMKIEFKNICIDLQKKYGPDSQYALYKLHGTYGGEEGIHTIGIFQSTTQTIINRV